MVAFMRRCGVLALVLSGFAGCGAALAQGVDPGDFSLDGLSRIEVPSPFHASDIIAMNGGSVHISHSLLGIPAHPVPREADIDAFSYGTDKLVPFGPRFFVSLEYSVMRGANGAGGAVSKEVTPPDGNGNAGDKFRLYRLFSGRVIGPWKEQDAEDIGLTPLPSPDESEIDGLSWPPGKKRPVFFSVNRDTAQTMGLDAAAIYVVADPPNNPNFTVYATSGQLGLVAGTGPAVGDNIDALAINDTGVAGVFDLNDVIYISLSPGVTDRIYFPPGGNADGVIQVSPAANPPVFLSPAGPLPGVIILGPQQLDLATTPQADNLDAITAFDPGPCWSKRDPPPKDQQAAVELRPWCEPEIEK